MGDYYLGFDIGGTQLKGGAIDLSGRLLRCENGETGPRAGREAILESLLQLARTQLRELNWASCGGLGVALPGFVEPAFGARSLPGKLPGLEGFPLRETLERELRLPVRCVNDAAAATLAEWRFGAAAGFDNAVVLTLGTGVGSGVVMNGRMLENAHLGTGGGIGQFTIQTGGRLCLCGNRGCAETLVSAEAVALRLRDHLGRGVASRLSARYFENPAAITFRSAIEGADLGDSVCREVLDEFIRDLGATIVTAIHAYNPSLVVIGGGPMAAADRFLPAVQAYVDRHRWVYPMDREIPVRPALHGTYAGVVGAAASAILGAGG
jgi:glucokinase